MSYNDPCLIERILGCPKRLRKIGRKAMCFFFMKVLIEIRSLFKLRNRKAVKNSAKPAQIPCLDLSTNCMDVSLPNGRSSDLKQEFSIVSWNPKQPFINGCLGFHCCYMGVPNPGLDGGSFQTSFRFGPPYRKVSHAWRAMHQRMDLYHRWCVSS